MGSTDSDTQKRKILCPAYTTGAACVIKYKSKKKTLSLLILATCPVTIHV